MKITYVGMHDLVETEFGDAVRGEPFEVPDSAAGRAPSGARGELDADGQPTWDPGEGYLAQEGNWQPWPLPKTSPAKKAAAKKAGPKPAAKPAAGDAESDSSDEKGNG